MQSIATSDLQTHLDVEELRRNIITLEAVLFMAAGGVAAWLILPAEKLDPYLLLIYLSVFGVGVAAYPLRATSRRLASAVLLIGPVAIYALSLARMPISAVPFFAVLIVILNAAVDPALGFASAVLSTIPLLIFVRPQGVLFPALALLWLTAVAEWVSSRGLYTALDWAWNSQSRANELVRQLRENQGALNRTVAALTEATRRLQRMGLDLATARVQADRLWELKSRFAANISHELRTPLNLILGFSETMHLTPDVYGDMNWPAPLRQDIRRIYQSSRQLSELIDDVLDLSRIDGGELPIHRQPCDLSTVVHDALNLIRDLLRGRNLTLVAQLPAELPRLYVDQTRIRQILVNLLNNAARFTRQGTITVSAEVTDGEVVVSVADTGIGISPEELPRIFDEYHQVDVSLRTAKDGVGLGLAISRRFVELHGGRIWAQSTLGEGSTFRFSLPVGDGAAYSHLVRTKPLAPRQSQEPTLLLVDQDPDVHALLSRYLTKYRIVPVDDVAGATALIQELQPHAVLINTVPDTEVQQALADQALRAVPPKLPVILCSIPSRSWTAHLIGADRCLLKPVQRDELLSALAEYPDADDVLIADDDAGFVQLMVRYLQTAGKAYRVRYAYDGERALAMLRESPPDLLLLDLIMPHLDGFELLNVLHADPDLASISVIIVTATDHAYSDLGDGKGEVRLLRLSGLGAMQTIEYLGALLDVSQPQSVSQGGPVQPAVAVG